MSLKFYPCFPTDIYIKHKIRNFVTLVFQNEVLQEGKSKGQILIERQS